MKAAKDKLKHALEMLHSLTDGINEITYMVDPDTHKILFANKKTQEIFGQNIVGKKCYRAFYKLNEPCPYCTNRYVFGENLGKTYIDEFQNPRNKRWYRCIDNSIKWLEGKYVLFEMAIDITEQKRIEKALRGSEEKFRVIAVSAKDAIILMNDRKRVSYLNPAAERIFGFTKKEAIGKKVQDLFIPKREHEKFFKKIEELMKTGKDDMSENNLEFVAVRKDGTEFPIELSYSTFQPEGRLYSVGMIRDITERKKAEEELIRLSNAVKMSADGIIVGDIHADIMYVNEAFLKMYGTDDKGDLIGKNSFDIIAPEDREKAFLNVEKLLENGCNKNMEYTIITKDGNKIPVEVSSTIIKDANDKVTGFITTVRDITKRKQVEEALRESEDRFRSVVENSHDSILIIDDNFQILYANDETERLAGYSKKELIGQDFRRFLEESSMPFVLDKYMRRLKGEDVPPQYEFKILRKNGETKDVEIKSSYIIDRQGRMRIIAQLLDITERKRIEEERKHFEASLSALNAYGQSLNMAKNMEEIYRLTLDATEKTLGFEYASILMIEGKMLCLAAHRGYSQNLSVRLPLDGEKGITVRVVKTGKPVFVPDIRKDKTYVKGGEGINSELAVPIRVRNKILGALNIESKKLSVFSEEDRKLLEILASHTAIAISNLNRQKKLSALNLYGRSLNKAENMEEICKQTLNAMEKILGFKFVDIFLVEGKILRLAATHNLSSIVGLNLPLDGRKGITVRAARIGKTVFIPDIRKEKAYVGAGVNGILSELAVPIKLGNKILGVLNVESDTIATFDEEDRKLLEILASHAAIAISNLKRQDKLRKLSERLEYLMKSSTEIIHVKNMHQRLKVIAKAIQNFGWRRVVISLRDENLEGTELVAAGLTKEETQLLLERKAPGHVWRERLGPQFEQFKIGEFYYLPWSDPWIRENVHGVPLGASSDEATTYAGVPSRLSTEEMVDWHPQDMIYAPLQTFNGKIVGILSMDDPIDGRKPTAKSLAPLELFLHQAAMLIENAQLIEGLREAREKLEEYAGHLEQKVEERTRELKESQEQLLKAQRLAVIGELAGMVGHDLRNPLTSIGGAQYYLKKRLRQEADSNIKEMLELIEKNIAYSNKIINDLLEYSREIKLDLTISNPKAVINEALSFVEIPKNIHVINLTKNKPKIRADVGKIERAFINIIKNAIEAMPKGGKLTINSKKTNDTVAFSFSDTGVGMSKETIEKLWTPLFTTKAKGMGFGLPICKRIIEAHGGAISVESVPRKGTTFTFTISIEPKIEEGGEKAWVTSLESLLSTTMRT